MPDKESCHHEQRHERGPSSFWMQNPRIVFDGIMLARGDRFLDLGCGPGDYAMEASGIVGDSGSVYALDKSALRIAHLAAEADSRGIGNITAMVSDITCPLPVEDGCIDVCLIATVLHIPEVSNHMKTIFAEVHRVLRPGGRLAIIECKKEEMSFGPPMNMRLSPEEIEGLLPESDYQKTSLADLGYCYLLQFVAKRAY
jgi:ubiquinone/menaquinone biosynthesis C-methylase UbiE